MTDAYNGWAAGPEPDPRGRDGREDPRFVRLSPGDAALEPPEDNPATVTGAPPAQDLVDFRLRPAVIDTQLRTAAEVLEGPHA